MTKSKSEKVTIHVLFPEIDIFPDEVLKMKFYYYVGLGIYALWFIAIDTYPEVVKKIYFSLLSLRMYLYPDRQSPW